MFTKMFRRTLSAGVVVLPACLLAGSAMAVTINTEGDYVPKQPVPIHANGVVHHGPIDCITARKIVRHAGYQDVETRDCRGEIYHFSAERNGHKVLLRVDREEGRVSRG